MHIHPLASSPTLVQHLDQQVFPVESAPDILIEADQLQKSSFHAVPLVDENNGQMVRYHVIPAMSRGGRPSGRSEDPLDLRTVQRRRQNFFLLVIFELFLLALANPFPYSPSSATWAFQGYEMADQETASRDRKRIRDVLRLMFALSKAMPSHVFGFNGLAGNSLHRLHFVSHLPVTGMPYPAQQVAHFLDEASRVSVGLIGPDQGYPLHIARFGYHAVCASVEHASEFITRLQGQGDDWTFNAAAVVEQGRSVLYVVPRLRSLRPREWPAQPGFLEPLGVGVVTDAEILQRVQSSVFRASDWRAVLASIRTAPVGTLL